MSWIDEIEPELRIWIKNSANEEFTIDEFHAHCEPFIEAGAMPVPPHNNSWGGLAVAASKRGLIQFADKYARATRVSAHGRKVQVWREAA